MKRIAIFFLALFVINGCGGSGSHTIKAPGMVEGEIITIKSKVSSKVKKLNVREGERVTAGKELVKFDFRILENKIEDVRLNLESVGLKLEKLEKKRVLIKKNYDYLKRQTNKFERLSRKKSISGDDLEKIKLKLLESETNKFEIRKSIQELKVQTNVLKNRRKYLEIMLEDYILTSGVDGVVMEKFVSMGENVFPGTPVLDILDLNSLYVEIFVEEEELHAVKIGLNVKIIVDGVKENGLSGVVSEIGRKAEFSPKYVISEVERKALLYMVKIRLDSNLDIFKIGMPVTVIIPENN